MIYTKKITELPIAEATENAHVIAEVEGKAARIPMAGFATEETVMRILNATGAAQFASADGNVLYTNNDDKVFVL